MCVFVLPALECRDCLELRKAGVSQARNRIVGFRVSAVSEKKRQNETHLDARSAGAAVRRARAPLPDTHVSARRSHRVLFDFSVATKRDARPFRSSTDPPTVHHRRSPNSTVRVL
jgi:hypothetical protein